MTKALLIWLAVGTTTYGGSFPALAAPINDGGVASSNATLMRGEFSQHPKSVLRNQELGLSEPDAGSRGAFLLVAAAEAGSRAWPCLFGPTPESANLSLGLTITEENDSGYGGFDHIFVAPFNAPISVPEPGAAALIATGAVLMARLRRKRN